MTTPQTSATPLPEPASTDHLASRLESLVGELVSCYEQLLGLAEQRLEAIRASNAQSLASCVRRENEIVQRVASLEAERSAVITPLASGMGSEHEGATRISWVARRLKGPEGERIGAMCAQLKSLAERLGAINEVARQAAEHLAKHMTGLLHAVSRHLNHAKTYSRAGSMNAGPRIVSSIDLSS